MEKRLKKYLKNGEFSDVTKTTTRVMSSIRGQNNKTTELILRMAIVRRGLKNWRLNCAELPGKPDIFFAQSSLAIFVDGCFWHGCPQCGHIPKTRTKFWAAKIKANRVRDNNTVRRLKILGINSVRIWEHELKSKRGIAQSLDKILKMVGNNE